MLVTVNQHEILKKLKYQLHVSEKKNMEQEIFPSP
ncbi:hypothetical protein CLOBOL_04182 [Enterocloster bolteae ATCC BAA-613]|uniref:Uncharacterized protein n=1 Tax=Enterocloster bolteae (strain ATCC BAA-613 / DSM 15670 / CCUG 46953 / JCM 12243 / WAL 16351) TaxID=411902 RepID=A8RV12_ENTBW|nr:hypothetical protein CLOBOL_04182 [Enterocloster bolteae ATCC BAA-613]